MASLFSYVIKFDTGAAPNPFWNLCTLTICKPIIRKTAQVGDWILGFGSTQVKLKQPGYKNYSGKLVYAMKVSMVTTLIEYDQFCQEKLQNKIPLFKTDDWRRRLGDCIYQFSNNEVIQRNSVHNEKHVDTDLSGINSLLSNHFYYFGSNAIEVPSSFQSLIHRGRGHKIIKDESLIADFQEWIKVFKKNKIFGDPQYRHKYDRNYKEATSMCK